MERPRQGCPGRFPAARRCIRSGNGVRRNDLFGAWSRGVRRMRAPGRYSVQVIARRKAGPHESAQGEIEDPARTDACGASEGGRYRQLNGRRAVPRIQGGTVRVSAWAAVAQAPMIRWRLAGLSTGDLRWEHSSSGRSSIRSSRSHSPTVPHRRALHRPPVASALVVSWWRSTGPDSAAVLRFDFYSRTPRSGSVSVAWMRSPSPVTRHRSNAWPISPSGSRCCRWRAAGPIAAARRTRRACRRVVTAVAATRFSCAARPTSAPFRTNASSRCKVVRRTMALSVRRRRSSSIGCSR